jgi:hypothetical protein
MTNKMFQTITDRYFDYIGNMPTTPYIPDSYYAPKPDTSLNFETYIINPFVYNSKRFNCLDLEEYEQNIKLNEQIRIKQNKIFDPKYEIYDHTWNYDERIVTPYEYSLITKIDIPKASNIPKISITSAIKVYDYADALLMCNETFSPPESLSVAPHVPRRRRVFNHSFIANPNSANLPLKTSPKAPKTPPKAPKTPKANNQKFTTSNNKKSHKKISHKKISHKKKL